MASSSKRKMNASESKTAPASTVRNAGIAIGLLVAVAAVYWPVYRYEFLNYDDPQYVSENAALAQGMTWQALGWSFTTFEGANWHPLTWISYLVDCELFGRNAGWHHVVNAGLHGLNSVLLFWVLSRLTGAVWPSAMVAALFALHPLHVESVAWIAERKDVLSAMFGLLTIGAYERYARRPSVSRYVLVAVLFACALMSKPMLVTLPCVLLLLDFWPLERVGAGQTGHPWRRLAWLVAEKLPLLALSAGSSVVTLIIQRRMGAMSMLGDELTVPMRLSNAVVSCILYLAKTVYPVGLCAFYPYVYQRPLWQLLAAALVLVTISGVAVWQMRRAPYLIVGWLWYLGMLVPVIGIVQVGAHAMADRYTYLPLVGVFIAVVWLTVKLVGDRARRVPLLAGLAAAALLPCLMLSARQVTYWRTAEVLFQHALDVTGENAAAHLNLGDALADNRRVAEAEEHLRKAILLDPQPRAAAHGVWARMLAKEKRFAEAEEHYREVLRLQPENASAHNELAMTVLAPQGRSRETVQQLREAYRLEPKRPEAMQNLAWALATCPDASLRDPSEAVRLAERAREAAQSPTAQCLKVLSQAYASAQRWPEAASAARQAASVARESGKLEEAATLEEQARQYEAGKGP